MYGGGGEGLQVSSSSWKNRVNVRGHKVTRSPGSVPTSGKEAGRERHVELRGLKCSFPGANLNTFSSAFGQPVMWSHVTRNGSCQHACAIDLLDVFPVYTAPGPESEGSARMCLCTLVFNTSLISYHQDYLITCLCNTFLYLV